MDKETREISQRIAKAQHRQKLRWLFDLFNAYFGEISDEDMEGFIKDHPIFDSSGYCNNIFMVLFRTTTDKGLHYGFSFVHFPPEKLKNNGNNIKPYLMEEDFDKKLWPDYIDLDDIFLWLSLNESFVSNSLLKTENSMGNWYRHAVLPMDFLEMDLLER